MAERSSWAGTASDLLRAATGLARDDESAGWQKNPGALAGRLCRAQTFLRVLGIEISFNREGRAGTQTIRITSGSRTEPPSSVLSASSAPAAATSRSTFEKPPQALGHWSSL